MGSEESFWNRFEIWSVCNTVFIGYYIISEKLLLHNVCLKVCQLIYIRYTKISLKEKFKSWKLVGLSGIEIWFQYSTLHSIYLWTKYFFLQFLVFYVKETCLYKLQVEWQQGSVLKWNASKMLAGIQFSLYNTIYVIYS